MDRAPKRAVVITGGDLTTTPLVDPDDVVIAADSGYDHAMQLGIAVDVLVGDLDSISAVGLAHAESSDAAIDVHPTDKDTTDLELALLAASSRGAASITIYGGEGGRLGHLIGVALSLASPAWASTDVAWHSGSGIVRAATPEHPVHLDITVSDTVTLLPVGTATGVRTAGLRWPLDGATLERGTARGVSNEAISRHVTVEVRNGAVLVIEEGSIPE